MSALDLRKLAGQTAVVTGAASGIGAAVARRAAALRMRVVLVDRDREPLHRTASDLTGTGAVVHPVVCDVRDAAAVDRLADTVCREFGFVRLFVGNAGVESTGRLWELPPDRFDQVLGVNVAGVFHGIRAFVPRLLESATPDREAIVVTVASIGSVTTMPAQAAYVASKHAALALTECLALELAQERKPVRVAAFLPGPVHTGIYDSAAADGAAGTELRDRMRGFLAERGVTAEAAAEALFTGIAAGDFWIFTDRDRAAELLRTRAERLVDAARSRADTGSGDTSSTQERRSGLVG
ncbi:SDR family NAD(P)-dependent oxidoreductase [Rhodococcus sp. NPDC003318]|uniref:SDR family NAD(P)-dependent oxidoreductase n=1 Tax=Rhodococcus sp. NPDC003318 TaxID=3364503 RepID=UPI0036B620D3